MSDTRMEYIVDPENSRNVMYRRDHGQWLHYHSYHSDEEAAARVCILNRDDEIVQLNARITEQAAELERLRAQLAEYQQWETCDIETRCHLISRAQFRGLDTLGFRIQRRKESEEAGNDG